LTGTTAELNLATATDSDDVEAYSVTSLVAALNSLDALFSFTTGHDHSGAHKGKPVTGAGVGTVSSPHFTSPVVDSGGLTITAPAATAALTLPGQSGGVAKAIAWTDVGAGLTSILGNNVGGAPSANVLRFDIATGTAGGSITALTLSGDGKALVAAGLTVAAGGITVSGPSALTGTTSICASPTTPLGFYGHAAANQPVAGPAATVLGDCITLANNLRAGLQSLGLFS
jgi:hypothetical protein